MRLSRSRRIPHSLLPVLVATVLFLLFSCTPFPRPTSTPLPTDRPAPPTPRPTEPVRLKSGDLTVTTTADRAAALSGEVLTFTVALTNSSGTTVSTGVTDTLPAGLSVLDVRYDCPSAAVLSKGLSSVAVTIPLSSSCRLFVAAVVDEGCNCAVTNQADWNGGGLSGGAESPPVWLQLPTVDYPAARDPLTDLNPLYTPFVTTTVGWIPHSRTSYDQTAGNADGFPLCDPPRLTDRCCTAITSTICTWTVIPANVSGLLTRLQMGQPVVCPPFNNVIADGRIELFSPPTATQPAATLNLSRLITYTDYPLVADGAYSGGGIAIYKPFRFDSGLRIRSVGVSAALFFEINYLETPPVTATTGWVAVPVTNTWQPASMGQTVDRLSSGTPSFQAVRSRSVSLSLAPGASESVFSEGAGAGTLVKVGFSQVERPGSSSETPSLFAGIQLQAHYGDAEDIAVELPLDWLFLSPWADYTPSRPPTQDLGEMAFSPTGKHVIIVSDTAWVLEAPSYDVAFQQHGTENGNAVWYRAHLSHLLQGTGALPPSSGLDAYSLHSLLGTDAEVLDQGEWVIKGPVYWSRGLTQTAWTSGTLQAAWGSDVNHPPTDRIDCQTFSFDDGSLPPRLTRYVISGTQYWTTTVSVAHTTPHTVTWQSGPLTDILPFYGGEPFGTFTVSRLGQIFTSEKHYWFCPAGKDCRRSESWEGPTLLSDAWWMGKWPNGADRVYGRGSLFYGYDEGDQEYYLTLPVPYRNGITVTLTSASPLACTTCTVSLTVEVEYTPQEYGTNAGYLDIRALESNQGTFESIWPNAVLATTLRGTGKLVGLVQKARGPIDPDWGRTFLEADDIIVADSDAALCEAAGSPPKYWCECDNRGTYVECGTGVEDFTNGGWFFMHGPFYLPTHGVARSMPNFRLLPPVPPYKWGWAPNTTYPYKYMGDMNRYAGPGYAETETLMYRFFLNDAIRFQRSLRLGLEFQIKSQDPRWTNPPDGQVPVSTTLGMLTIAYLAPP